MQIFSPLTIISDKNILTLRVVNVYNLNTQILKCSKTFKSPLCKSLDLRFPTAFLLPGFSKLPRRLVRA